MKLIHDLESKNPVTTRNAFIVIAIIALIGCLVAKIVFHVNFEAK